MIWTSHAFRPRTLRRTLYATRVPFRTIWACSPRSLICRKTSSPPSSGSMKPYPFSWLNRMIRPVATYATTPLTPPKPDMHRYTGATAQAFSHGTVVGRHGEPGTAHAPLLPSADDRPAQGARSAVIAGTP